MPSDPKLFSKSMWRERHEQTELIAFKKLVLHINNVEYLFIFKFYFYFILFFMVYYNQCNTT